jgi:hypothetical protein
MLLLSRQRRLLPIVLIAAAFLLLLTGLVSTRIPTTYARTTTSAGPTSEMAASAPLSNCTAATCTFTLGINPGLLSGTFACPAIQQATATITITNRFANDAQNDVMTLTASGLPKNTGFDMFTVQNSPLDSGTFNGFGYGWYQSDVNSNAQGNVTVKVQGIFDKETFIENPSSLFTPIHTFNVGFWFDSPANEKAACGNATAPAKTPFNGEQDAGLLAMITQGEPLQFVV